MVAYQKLLNLSIQNYFIKQV